MNQNHYTVMGNGKHLSVSQRETLEAMIEQGYSITSIANILKKHRSTIYREIQRGKVAYIDTRHSGYLPTEAYSYQAGQYRYEKHRKACKKVSYLTREPQLKAYLDRHLNKQDGSPEVIYSKLIKDNSFKVIPCVKTIYRWVDQKKLKIRNIDLLRKSSLKPRKTSVQTAFRVFGRSIEERPGDINTRETFNHWEVDTILGEKRSGSSVLLSLVERKSRQLILRKLDEKTKDQVYQVLSSIQEETSLTSITSDNGKEFVSLPEFEKSSGVTTYYAHPYAAHERGTNENVNGLVRRYFPKGTNFNKVTDEQVRSVQDRINSMPRKLFNFKSSQEVYQSMIEST